MKQEQVRVIEKEPAADSLLDDGKVIKVGEIGGYTDLMAVRRDILLMVRRHNIKRALIEAYKKGIPLGRPMGEASGDEAADPGDLADVNKKAIEDALVRHAHNRSRAAKDLGITRRALLRKIEKYKIESLSCWGPGKRGK